MRHVVGVLSVMVFLSACQQAGVDRVEVAHNPDPQVPESVNAAPDTIDVSAGAGDMTVNSERRLEDYVGLMPRLDVIDPSLPRAKKLLELSPSEVELIFGAPRFLREEFEAQVLQYRSPQCVADFFFYAVGENSPMMRYYEFRPLDPQELAVDDDKVSDVCIASFFEGRIVPDSLKASTFPALAPVEVAEE